MVTCTARCGRPASASAPSSTLMRSVSGTKQLRRSGGIAELNQDSRERRDGERDAARQKHSAWAHGVKSQAHAQDARRPPGSLPAPRHRPGGMLRAVGTGWRAAAGGDHRVALILANGTVVTMDGSNRVISPGSVAIDGTRSWRWTPPTTSPRGIEGASASTPPGRSCCPG